MVGILGHVALEGSGQTPYLLLKTSSCLDFQYFEYTTQRDLRHNVAKQLCLHASASTLGLRNCRFTGKNRQVPKDEEWVLTQVSHLPRNLGIKNPRPHLPTAYFLNLLPEIP